MGSVSDVRAGVVRRDRGTTAVLIGAALGACAFVWWVAADLAARDPLPGRPLSEPAVTFVAMLADVVARLSALVALACTLTVAMAAGNPMVHRWAGRAGQAWLWAALLGTVANPAYVNGLGLGVMLSPGQWWAFQVSTPSSLAWLGSALAALSIVVVSYRRESRAASAIAYGAGVLTWIFVMVTGNVTIGLDHDWATDALSLVGFVMVPLLTSAVALAISQEEGTTSYRRLLPAALVIAALGHGVVAWQQLAGSAPGDVYYGLAVSGAFVCLGLMGLTWMLRLLRPGRHRGLALADAVIALAYVAIQTAEAHIPSPRYFLPQTTQINYLGYEVVDAPIIARLVGLGRPNVLWVTLALAAVASYGLAVVALRRRGESWPLARTLCWLGGWALVGYLAVSGLWAYSTVLYSWHMVVHMTINMLIPVLLVLGAPLTLLHLSVSGPRETERRALVRLSELIDLVTDHRLVQRVMSPPVLWVNYVGSLFLVYFTPLFTWLMRYHWAHQLMLVYFLLTGYAFFALIVGIDRQGWNLPYIVRLALVISIMPFHAIFAVSIMSSQTIIGSEFYRAIALPWVKDLLAEQNIAGQATWLLGEVPLLIVMVALSAQWFMQDRREASATDQGIDSGTDDSLDAYNDMLAELAARDERGAR